MAFLVHQIASARLRLSGRDTAALVVRERRRWRLLVAARDVARSRERPERRTRTAGASPISDNVILLRAAAGWRCRVAVVVHEDEQNHCVYKRREPQVCLRVLDEHLRA